MCKPQIYERYFDSIYQTFYSFENRSFDCFENRRAALLGKTEYLVSMIGYSQVNRL